MEQNFFFFSTELKSWLVEMRALKSVFTGFLGLGLAQISGGCHLERTSKDVIAAPSKLDLRSINTFTVYSFTDITLILLFS